MVSTRPLISKSSSPGTNLLVTVPSAQFTIGIIVTFMFHSFFSSSLARFMYYSLSSLSFSFTLWSAGKANSTIRQVLFSFFFSFFFFFFFFCWLSLCLVVWPKLNDPLYLKIPEKFLHLIFYGFVGVGHKPFVRMAKFILLAQFPVNHFPYPVLFAFALTYCIRLLCDWSFHLYPHITYICHFLHLFLLWHMALFCATIRRDLVSLLRFSFS